MAENDKLCYLGLISLPSQNWNKKKKLAFMSFALFSAMSLVYFSGCGEYFTSAITFINYYFTSSSFFFIAACCYS